MDALLAPFTTFLFILTRVSGWVMTVPFFGGTAVPMRFRAFLAIGLALIMTPLQHSVLTSQAVYAPPQDVFELAVLLGRELFVGLAMGLAMLILFSGLQFAGHLIAQLGGMAIANVFDPTAGTSAPIFAQFLRMLGVAVFVAINGHRQFVTVMLESYTWMPPGNAINPGELAPTLVNVFGVSLILGLRAAAPIIVALMLSMLILGLLSRTVPQLNLLVVGFPINAMVAMCTLLISLGTIYYFFGGYVDHTLEELVAVLRGG